MKKAKTIAAVMVLAVRVSSYAYDDGDFQVWNTDVQEFKVNKDLKAALEQEVRWGDNAHEFFYQHYDVGAFYGLNKYWNIGAGYRHVLSKTKGEFKIENEPYMTATLSGEAKGFKFEDRSRLEYQHFDYQTDSWRYRNKFTLKLPWKFTKMAIQPFLSEEALVRFGVINEFNQNRFSSGLAMNLTKNIKAEIYYMLVSSKSRDNWIDSNVLGTKLKFSF